MLYIIHNTDVMPRLKDNTSDQCCQMIQDNTDIRSKHDLKQSIDIKWSNLKFVYLLHTCSQQESI